VIEVSDIDSFDAILIGGPRDGTPFRAEGSGLVTLEVEGLVHRYIRTTERRQRGGQDLLVYNYDGEVRESSQT
jgi:hypothetical protein